MGAIAEKEGETELDLGGHDLERSQQREGERGLRETLGFGSGNWDSHWCLSHNKVRTKQYFLICRHLARFSLSRDRRLEMFKK